MAKRLAGEGEAEKPKTYNRPKLSQTELIALRMMTGRGGKGITALEIGERVGGGNTESSILFVTMAEIRYCLPNGNTKPRNKPFALDSALFERSPS